MYLKGKLIFALGALLVLSAITDGQDVSTLNQLTLYAFRAHRDWGRASIKFDASDRPLPPSQADITYGNLAINDDSDWFSVHNPSSMIVDLGAKDWRDFTATPSFFKGQKPRKPLPLSKPMVVDASAGSKEISPYQQFVQVKAGHMYLMKVVDKRGKTYVMFRVDDLLKKDRCILSWKKVPPPVDDFEK